LDSRNEHLASVRYSFDLGGDLADEFDEVAPVLGTALCIALGAQAAVYAQGEPHYSRARELASRAGQDASDIEQVEEQIREVLSAIPLEVAKTGAALQGQLHSQALSTILMCCFCLESYINSFAYFLLKESDFLGLSRVGRKSSAEAVLDAIDRLSTKEKWTTVGKLGGADGFDRSRTPFQDFRCLFNFRDDHVHDKAVPYGEDRPAKRYNGKFPDPVGGLLDLGYALYAAEVYWSMVHEIHDLTGVEPSEFHRHYNLKPWFGDENWKSLRQLADRYRLTFPAGS
jgi:hypothetical protein